MALLMRLSSTVLIVALFAITTTIAWVLTSSVHQTSEIGEETEEIGLVVDLEVSLHQETQIADVFLNGTMSETMPSEMPSDGSPRSSGNGDPVGAAEEGETPSIAHPNWQDHGSESATSSFQTTLSQLAALAGDELSQVNKVGNAHEMYVGSVAELHNMGHGVGEQNSMGFFHANVQPLEAETHEAIFELRRAQNEEIFEAVEVMGALETLLTVGVPALLVLGMSVAFAVYRLRTAWRRQQMEELEKINRTKSEFIATVSHELRTPLTSVVGFAELLSDADMKLSPSERAEMTQSIVHQSFEVAGIVEDLLVASRTELGELTIVSVPVDLQAQATKVLESSRFDPAIQVETTAEIATALGDPLRVRQILRNLVRNAALYGGDLISIEVGATSPSSVYLSVKDNGVGVPPENRDHMFEPFQRGFDTTAPLGSIGLGLTVSRQLARLMEGDLTYRYKNGESIFTLSLPATPATSHPTPQAADHPIQPRVVDVEESTVV